MSEGSELHIDEHDSLGKKIGVLASILAVLLSIFTISAHRAHTETIELQNETNDIWSHYQAKRIRQSQIEMNLDLIRLMAPDSGDKNNMVEHYTDKQNKYAKELEIIKIEADKAAEIDARIQKKALYFDFAEGVLEISLILSSLYFISRKKLFPILGLLFGCFGALAGVIGLLI